MKNIKDIIAKIDEFLEKSGKSSTNPVEANEMLARAGLLKDSDLRPGLPLRNTLRSGQIPHAYQAGGKGSSWVIPHSNGKKKIPFLQKNGIEVIPISLIKPKVQQSSKPSFIDIDFNNIESLKKHGFTGFQSIESLNMNSSSIPKKMGIYIVVYLPEKEPSFLQKGTGGNFKKKDPNLPIKELQENWVRKTKVVYIGKAGGNESNATLYSRIEQYLDFGHGKPVGHWGGRLIWQIENSGRLLLCWKPLTSSEPRDEELRLIQHFSSIYGKRPYANLKD
jgi:hypothetical protein